MDDSAPQTPTTPILEPSKHRQLPWLVVVLSFLVLSAIAVLALQNLKLKKQLSSSPQSSLISLIPSISSSPSPDTPDWKTYANTNDVYCSGRGKSAI